MKNIKKNIKNKAFFLSTFLIICVLTLFTVWRVTSLLIKAEVRISIPETVTEFVRVEKQKRRPQGQQAEEKSLHLNEAVARATGVSSDRIGGLSLQETEEFFEEKKRITKISLVISYYETPLNWMGDFFGGAQDGYQITDITIISKNQKTDEILGLSVVEAIGESVEIIHLSNVGRCDHSYAYWIKEMLPKLNKEHDGDDVVMFLKDNDYDFQYNLPRTFEEVFRATVERGLGCFTKPIYRTSLLFHERAVVESFWMKSYQRLGRDKNDTFKSKYSRLKDWRDGMGLTFPKADYVPVCYGGFFSTKKRGLFSQTREAWENMEKNLSRGNNIEEGHFAERSWASLVTYTSDVELTQISTAFKPYIDYIFDAENKSFSRSGMVMIQPHSHFSSIMRSHRTSSEAEERNGSISPSYSVCNGPSCQFLGHAGHIAECIASGKDIFIPNVFITSKTHQSIGNVYPNQENSVPLHQIIDMDALFKMLRSHYGVKAQTVPFDKVVSLGENDLPKCSCQVSDHQIAQEILRVLKPSPRLPKVLQESLSNIFNHIANA